MQPFTLYSLASPSSVDTQAIVDRELQAAQGAIDAWISVFYYPRALLDVGDQTEVDGGLVAYQCHAASPYKSYVKRCLMLSDQVARGGLVGDATWKYFNGANSGVLQTFLLAEFADPHHARIDGRLVLGYFMPSTITATGNATANWNALLIALGGRNRFYLIGYGDSGHAASATLGFDMYAGYGPSGYLPAGAGQHSSSDQATKDQSISGATGSALLVSGNRQFDVLEAVNVLLDGRPIGASIYSDCPTLPDEIARLRAAKTLAEGGRSRPSVVQIGEAHDECSEGGTLAPTAQKGDRHYRAARRARGSLVGGTETYEIDSSTIYVVASGSWTTIAGSAVAGAYESQERESSTAGDTLSLLCDSRIIDTAAGGTIGFRCPKGAVFGIADFLLNGVSQGTVDLGAGSTTRHNLVKTIAVAAGDTVAFKASGTHSVGSTNAVRLDSYEVTYNPP